MSNVHLSISSSLRLSTRVVKNDELIGMLKKIYSDETGVTAHAE